MEWKDKLVANEVTRIHDEEDDTLGHKKLATLIGVGKNRVLRVMHKYSLKARKRSKNTCIEVNPLRFNQILPIKMSTGRALT